MNSNSLFPDRMIKFCMQVSQNIKTRPKFKESFKKKKRCRLILVQIENLIYILIEFLTKQLAEVCLKYFSESFMRSKVG